MSQRWIESLNGDRPVSATKDSLLPKGEGQDEGEPWIERFHGLLRLATGQEQ
jgi:hypothetical protein